MKYFPSPELCPDEGNFSSTNHQILANSQSSKIWNERCNTGVARRMLFALSSPHRPQLVESIGPKSKTQTFETSCLRAVDLCQATWSFVSEECLMLELLAASSISKQNQGPASNPLALLFNFKSTSAQAFCPRSETCGQLCIRTVRTALGTF